MKATNDPTIRFNNNSSSGNLITLDIALGSNHSCHLLQKNSKNIVKCLGNNAVSIGYKGYIGTIKDQRIGSLSELQGSKTEVKLGTDSYPIHVEVFDQQACAVFSNYKLKCWGDGASGGLMNESFNSLGLNISDMGDNLPYINLGVGRTVNNSIEVDQAITIGTNYVCVILDNDSLKCWGEGLYGRLGLNTITDYGSSAGSSGDNIPNVNLISGAPVQIESGSTHTCVLFSDGSVKCWGDGASGKTVQGNQTDLLIPSALSIGTGLFVSKIALGYNHSCFLLTNGNVKCWGDGAYGKLGKENMLDLGDSPAELGDNNAYIDLNGETAIDIVSSTNSTCIITNNYTVKCWGYNFSGQLGIGSNQNIGDAVNEMGSYLMPVNLGTGRFAVKLFKGYGNYCAKLDNDDVKCWGSNSFGVLGLGHDFDIGASPISMGDNLAPLELGATIQTISSGANVACALLDTNKVKCWGDASIGERGNAELILGNESSDISLYPTIDPGYGNYFTSIKSLNYTNCGILDNGEMLCWGEAGMGLLGYGGNYDQGNEKETSGENFLRVQLGEGVTVKSFSIGMENVCAILGDDTLKCWGEGDQGVNAQGNTTDLGTTPGDIGISLSPVDLGSVSYPVQVEVGYYHACVRFENGNVKCWGSNTGGELGQDLSTATKLGLTSGDVNDSLSPINLGIGKKAVDICSGVLFSCALLDDSTVRCWGDGLNGKTGQGSTLDYGTNINSILSASDVDLGTGFIPTDIECKYSHACAVSSLGELKCWGDNFDSQLGNGSSIDVGYAAGQMGNNLNKVNVGSNRFVKKVFTGFSSTCVILDNDLVKCWGENLNGVLGLGHDYTVGDHPFTMGDNLNYVEIE